MVIVITSSKGRDGEGFGDAYVLLGCERSLSYRRNKSNSQEGSTGQTGTKRCQCPFHLKGAENVGGTWTLCILNGNHNHTFPESNVGRSIISRLNVEEAKKAKEMARAHVKTAHILVSIKDDVENLTTLKQLYNFKHKIRCEELEGRSRIQQLLKYLDDESYIHWHRANESTNQLTDLFFANRRAVHMLRLFYFVLIMDCTYKTNKYKMPLLQIVGCAPTGKNFTIRFAFLNEETKESYGWALRCVRHLFDADHVPEVIVTDRDLALMHAIDSVFPESYHMLCTRHIAKNVEARVKFHTRSRFKSSEFCAMWTEVVDSETDEEYERNIRALFEAHSDKPKMLKYVNETWMVYSRKFVKAFTKKRLHLDNRTTNRVESAHNALKRFLGTSTESLDTIWKKLHSLLQLQDSEIRGQLVKSENVDLHITVMHLLGELSGKVSHFAIKKIIDEYDCSSSKLDRVSLLSCYP